MIDVESEDHDEIDLIVDLIESIFDKDNVYDAKDVKREELVDFVENITNKQFMKIKEKFFETMPSLEHTTKYKCSKCGYEGEYTFRGISDFF
jgi:rubrerythrin